MPSPINAAAKARSPLAAAGRHDSVNLLKFCEMDAILAVAIGGNALGGGKFSIPGSIIGAYTIEVLNRTLLRLEVDPEAIKAFKAVFIIILMVVSSPVLRGYVAKARIRTQARLSTAVGMQAAGGAGASAPPKSDSTGKEEA